MALEQIDDIPLKDENKVRAGRARAEILSPDRRREIARNAAKSRWESAVPKAEYTGTIKIADVEIPCAVVEIKGEVVRLVVQREVVNLLTGSRKGILDRYLGAKNLQEYVPKKFKDKNLNQATYVVEMNGRRAFGYNGEDIVDICKMYLDARKAGNVLLPNQIQLADRAEIIVTSLAKLGITALIDEATGYQQVRARDALQAYLDRVLRKSLAAWVKRFPDEFYEQMYRLKKWKWSGTSSRPHVAANYTTNIVYARLGPRILGELEKLNPKKPQGGRKGKHHQWLTDEVGHPQLAQHLYAVIGLMRISDNWEQFMKLLDRAYPKQDEDQLHLFI